MGRPMAERLIRAGHSVRIHRVKPASQYLTEIGGIAEESAQAAVRNAQIVILMLPDTPDVESVLFGSQGVASGISAGAILVDMSSISPLATQDFARRLSEAGAHYVDAPVSGGEVGAKNGTLSIMVGGDEHHLAGIRPILEILGQTITHTGPVGAGQFVKIANQIVVGLTIECVSEAFVLAKRAGVDLQVVRDALMGGFAQSRILEIHGQRMIDAAHEPGFAMRLHHKDLGLAIEAAEQLEIGLPNTRQTFDLMGASLSAGFGQKDHSALFKVLDDGATTLRVKSLAR